MEHYYTPPENISGSKLTITDEEAKHLSKVLRKETGTEIFVTDGTGNLYTCIIDEIRKHEITCSITDKQFNINEPDIKLTTYISVLKNPSRFEFAVEKLTELGVYAIQPIITEHVISKGKDRSERWQSIALSAMKQSQRCILPKVYSPIDFEQAINSCVDDIKYIAHEKSTPPLQVESGLVYDSSKSKTRGGAEVGSVSLFIGPEGGFTEAEIDLAEKKGFKIISLGLRKYRSETAAIAAASLILLF